MKYLFTVSVAIFDPKSRADTDLLIKVDETQRRVSISPICLRKLRKLHLSPLNRSSHWIKILHRTSQFMKKMFVDTEVSHLKVCCIIIVVHSSHLTIKHTHTHTHTHTYTHPPTHPPT